ncbi:MAG: 1-deoxy-D-xylulose-5-phosphate synthase [Spirochaetales bacterium]|nr:1-deoxy-D-xylulose-5-phosphate synthase [Spirochaetales bacterium]
MEAPEYPLLRRIRSPEDLKKIPAKDLPALAAEIRSKIVQVVSRNGGHLASNLGVVELSIILHKMFYSPVDKIVWDVGHQCYPHKLLTGRFDQIDTIRQKNGLSGFPKMSESAHDIVETGHASTSISAALGILSGQQIQGIPGKVVAVIGDGSFTGGLAFEALNHAGHLGKNLIIVLNDNQMSIAPNVGALSGYLSRITATRLYQNIRTRIDVNVKRIPVFGDRLLDLIERLKKAVKAVFFNETLFSDLGFEYVGPIDGHNLNTLTSVFKNVRYLNKPVVVHVATQKGRGYPLAEGDPTRFHGVGPFSLVDGKIEEKSSLSFSDAFARSIVTAAEKNASVAAITAAMANGTGLAEFQSRFPERFFDVGITEQHAVTFAAGLAISGLRPVVSLYSTFLQRSVDQVIHDVALPGLPVVITCDRAGVVGGDGETHQGIYDLAFFRPVKGLTILSPGTAEELDSMLLYSLASNGPSLIRYPKASCFVLEENSLPLEPGRGVFVRKNSGESLIITTGGLLSEAVGAADRLAARGIISDVYNLRFIKPLDQNFLLDLAARYERVLVVEDAVEYGGVGEFLAAMVGARGEASKWHFRSIPEVYDARGTRNELLHVCGLDAIGIAEMLLEEKPARRFYRLTKPASLDSGMQ